MAEQLSCPQCTIFNHPDNDECVGCRMKFPRREREGQRNQRRLPPRGQALVPPDNSESDNTYNPPTTTKDYRYCYKSLMSILETIWLIFMLFFYTLYTIIVTWTADSIFQSIVKISVYLSILLILYCMYYSTPYIIRKTIDFLKWTFKLIKKIPINPLVIIGFTLIIVWLTMLTIGYQTSIQRIESSIDDIYGKITGIQLNVTTLQIEVVKLKDRITNIEIDLDKVRNEMKSGFEVLGNNIKAFDRKLVDVTDKWNKTYSEWLEGDGLIKKADTYVRETMYTIFKSLSSRTITRQEFGLGCFMKGTEIQIDKKGNDFVNIEELKDGDFVYSPTLDKLVKIKILFLFGEETGTMYEIQTSDLLSVIVTETHPMKICDEVICHNVAAKDVFVGNTTKTVNGDKDIISVEQISVEKALVYNFMLDVEDVVDISRDVIANGIISLDLEAQKKHY